VDTNIVFEDTKLKMRDSCSQMMVQWCEDLYARDQMMVWNAWLVQPSDGAMMRGFVRERPNDGMRCVTRAAKWWCNDARILYARDQMMVWNAWLMQPSDGAMIWGFVYEKDQLMERPMRDSCSRMTVQWYEDLYARDTKVQNFWMCLTCTTKWWCNDTTIRSADRYYLDSERCGTLKSNSVILRDGLQAKRWTDGMRLRGSDGRVAVCRGLK
jgi:hypothetical protein